MTLPVQPLFCVIFDMRPEMQEEEVYMLHRDKAEEPSQEWVWNRRKTPLNFNRNGRSTNIAEPADVAGSQGGSTTEQFASY
ncbi:hypothetical protein scyTo_0005511 [Scyliorhinus torazame]|uniref:Uncharacterized protein n=1 Tax=Scyliorhinus torazame TaxID=75743 RepID=A0A401P8Y0_SCYTO|nr:hypothetical protein [Scyliorhinus torazame]